MGETASGRPNEKKAYLLFLGFPFPFPKRPTTDVVVSSVGVRNEQRLPSNHMDDVVE